MDGRSVGLIIVVCGLGVIILGFLISTGAFSWFGKLPGDIRIQGKSWRFQAPFVSMLVISVVASGIYIFIKNVL